MQHETKTTNAIIIVMVMVGILLLGIVLGRSVGQLKTVKPAVSVYEDMSAIIDYDDYELHFDDKFALEYIVITNTDLADSFGCDALDLQGRCMVVGEDIIYELLSMVNGW